MSHMDQSRRVLEQSSDLHFFKEHICCNTTTRLLMQTEWCSPPGSILMDIDFNLFPILGPHRYNHVKLNHGQLCWCTIGGCYTVCHGMDYEWNVIVSITIYSSTNFILFFMYPTLIIGLLVIGKLFVISILASSISLGMLYVPSRTYL